MISVVGGGEVRGCGVVLGCRYRVVWLRDAKYQGCVMKIQSFFAKLSSPEVGNRAPKKFRKFGGLFWKPPLTSSYRYNSR